jgi:outer membrane protein assembly factor BamB
MQTYLLLCCLMFNDGATPAWPGFLGQGASAVDSATIPTTWSPTENIAWKTKLPGKGQSSPVIWGDKIFVTAIDGTMKDHCHVIALNLNDGQIVWDQKLDPYQPVRSNYFQSRSAPTPLVDANGVYAFFETGNLVAFSLSGEQLWQRGLTEDYGAFESTIGIASSPLQLEDSIVLLIDHEGPSYLLAVDKKTGETKWKTDRDSRTSYASPSLVPVGDAQHIVCSSSGSIDGYDPSTGELLWTLADEVGGNRATTPLAAGNGRFVMAASPGMHNENEGEARRTNGIVTIEKTVSGFAAKVLWRTEEAMPAFNTPTVHNGLAYWVNKAGVVFCYNAETGEKHYSKRIDQSCWATPIVVGDRLYVFGKDGLTSVLAIGTEFNLIAENELWDPNEIPSESMARNRAAGRDENTKGGHEHGDEKKDEPAQTEKPEAKPETKPTAAEGEATPTSAQAAAGNDGAKTAPDEKADGERPARRGPPDGAVGGRPDGGRPEGAGRPGGPPGRGGSYDAQTMSQGENRFADPVQYGVAIVNGSIVIRTGEIVYCVRAK